MKKLTTLLLSTGLLSGFANAQLAFTTLDQNNSSGIITDVGEFFNNTANSTAGYEIPKGSGRTAIYSAAMWYQGTDVNGQVKLAAPKYYPTQDMWPGALSVGPADLPSPNPLGQTLWMVTKNEINDHINNYSDPSYIMPGNILNWPAHGDTTVGQAYYLAPYVDVDNDGEYMPQNGDYPCIKGDKAVYTIANDKGGVHGSTGDPIGIEVHYMFYQYSTNDAINDVTFIDAHIINRGTQTLNDYVTSFWLDGDLGNYQDDYFGSDSTRNLIFTYNGDNMDEDNAGTLGYDSMPPAIGLVCLNADVSSAGTFSNGAFYPYSDPTTPVEYRNIMHGKWLDGSDWLDNNGQVTKFQFSGDPNDGAQWSEYSAASIPGDRRMIMSIEKDVLFAPWEEFDLSFAVVFAQDSTALSSVSKLYQVTDEVQSFYDNDMVADCYGSNVSVTEEEFIDLVIYPNPSAGVFTVKASTNEELELSLVDMSGRVIEQQLMQNGQTKFVTNANPGVYVLRVTSSRGDVTRRVIVE